MRGHRAGTWGPGADLAPPGSRQSFLHPSWLADADAESKAGRSLAGTPAGPCACRAGATGTTLSLLLPTPSVPPTRELPGPAGLASGRGAAGAPRPRHLMQFPAGGRRAEKSETPPSTSASRPRSQSTKGGGRSERGWSRRAEGARAGQRQLVQARAAPNTPAPPSPVGAPGRLLPAPPCPGPGRSQAPRTAGQTRRPLGLPW